MPIVRPPVNALQLKIVYLALIASTFIYAAIVWMLYGQRAPAETIEQELHRPVILIPMVMSLAMFAVSFAIGGEDRSRRIMRWAITESVTIFALVAAFLASDWRLFAIGWALSLVGFVLAWPAAEEA